MSIAINTAQISGLLTRKHGVPEVVIVKNRLNSLAFNRYFAVIMNLISDDSQIQQSKGKTLCQTSIYLNFI